jgi:RimJ/RimL family protein N-acetyltransferase
VLRAGPGRLTTPRLVLEPLRVEHARELAPLLDDPALHEYTGGEPDSEEALGARYERQLAGHSPDGRETWLNWVVRDGASGAAVGTVQATVAGDEAELAWVIATARQGEGLATEAARAAQEWLRGQGVARFVAHVHPRHAASAAVARHLGMAPGEPRADGELRWAGG